jgi:hypothetical protein
VTPGRAIHDTVISRRIARGEEPGVIAWQNVPGADKADLEAGGQAAIEAGGWTALAAEIEALPIEDGASAASTILVQVCRAVAFRLTGSRPKGTVSAWIDDEGDGDAKVTVAWGLARKAEKEARGE